MTFNFGSANTGGGGIFGRSATSTSGFTFGSTNKTTASAFTFPTATTSSATAFGGFSGFGGKTTTAPSLFGGFSAKTSSTTLFSGGNSTTAFSFQKPDASKGIFSQQQQQQQHHTANQALEENAASVLLATATALSAPHVFGDERDAIMTKWNQIQAFWGVGRGFYRKDGAHIPFTPQNHFCRFKAVGYSCLPTAKDEEGFIAIMINKKESEIREIGEAKIQEAIHKILGNSPALVVKVDTIRHVPEDKCEITIYVSEQSTTTGTVRRVPATELHSFMQQQNIQMQLKQQILMESCVPRVMMPEQQIRNIIANPPAGIDPVIWEQAKRDNPDPKSLIPVPMIGFSELRNRLRLQEQMSKQHQTRLDILSKELHDMQQQQVSLQSKIDQYKRKLLEMSHRVLLVITAQEIYRKSGYAVQLEEEQLRVHLEALYNELNAPTQFRGRLNELLSQTRLHHFTAGGATGSDMQSTFLDEDALKDINKHLRKQQEGLNTLVAILHEDMNDLKLIDTGLLADEGTQQHYGMR